MRPMLDLVVRKLRRKQRGFRPELEPRERANRFLKGSLRRL